MGKFLITLGAVLIIIGIIRIVLAVLMKKKQDTLQSGGSNDEQH